MEYFAKVMEYFSKVVHSQKREFKKILTILTHES